MPSATRLVILNISMGYLGRTVPHEQAQSGQGTKVEAEPLAKVIGPGTCGLPVCQQQACRYNLTGGSKPVCFRRLRILNAFEIALWQTGSTSKRADVVLGLSATTTAESSKLPTPRGRKVEDAHSDGSHLTGALCSLQNKCTCWTYKSMGSTPEKDVHLSQARQDFCRMRRAVLGMNQGCYQGAQRSIPTWLGCRSPSLLNLSHQRGVGQFTHADPGCAVRRTHGSCSSAWHPGLTDGKASNRQPPYDQYSTSITQHQTNNSSQGSWKRCKKTSAAFASYTSNYLVWFVVLYLHVDFSKLP